MSSDNRQNSDSSTTESGVRQTCTSAGIGTVRPPLGCGCATAVSSSTAPASTVFTAGNPARELWAEPALLNRTDPFSLSQFIPRMLAPLNPARPDHSSRPQGVGKPSKSTYRQTTSNVCTTDQATGPAAEMPSEIPQTEGNCPAGYRDVCRDPGGLETVVRE